MDFESLQKFEKWLSANSDINLLKKWLNKVAFLLVIVAYLLDGGISLFLYWTGILTAIFGTYLNWRFK